MKIILSPAKTMRENDGIDGGRKPILIEEAKELLEELKKYSSQDLAVLMKCNLKLADLNYERFQRMNLDSAIFPALLCFDGLQYKAMAPHVFTSEEYAYVKEHCVILSGLYGLLRADDLVCLYRLEMQTELKFKDYKNLYDFWQDKIYKELYKENDVVLNLASKEYSRVVENHLKENDRMITCVFGYLEHEKVKVKGTLAKMARGAMVRWMAENQIEDVEEIKHFKENGYAYSETYSTKEQWVFLK